MDHADAGVVAARRRTKTVQPSPTEDAEGLPEPPAASATVVGGAFSSLDAAHAAGLVE
jgi:hypothetical protein